MADENIDIEVTGFQSLKAQIKEAQIEYQKLLSSVSATPAAISAAAAKVGELKETLADANDTANAFTTQGKFQAVTKSLAAVAGGFTAIQGAISLAGGDAKDFEKTFQKVQGAMALTQGLTAIADLGDAFGNLKKVAVTAFNGIKAAIGSTGIGLLVIALGAIYAYWDDIKAAVSGVDAEQKKLNADSAANLAMQEKQLAAISAQENILRLQGMSEEEIYKLKLDQFDATIKASKANIANLEITEKKQIETAQRNKDILQGIIRFLTIPLTALLYTVDLIGKALGQDFGLEESFSGGLAKLVFDPAEIKKEGDKAIEETKTALTKLENERAGMILAHDAKRDGEQKAREQKAKEARDKEEGLQKTHLEKVGDLQDKYGELMITDEDARTLRTLENKQKKERSELQILIDSYAKKKNLTKSEEATLKVLRDEFAALTLLQAKETEDKKAEITKKAAEKVKADYKEIATTISAAERDQLIHDLHVKQALIAAAANAEEEALRAKGKFTEQLEKEAYDKSIALLYDVQAKRGEIEKKYNDGRLATENLYNRIQLKGALEAAQKEADVILTSDKTTAAEKTVAREELEKKLLKIQIDSLQEQIDQGKKYGLSTIDLEKEQVEKKRELYAEDTKNNAEAWLEKNKVALETIAGTLQALTASINAAAEIQKYQNQVALEDTKAKFDGEAKILKDKYDFDIDQAGLTADQKEAIETDYANASNAIEFDRATENYKREKDGFENGKKVQYAQAIIAGIQGALGAFSSLAPIPVVGVALGIAAAAAVAVTTAFQLATISKTTYSGTAPVKPKKVVAGGGGAAGGEGSSGSKFAEGGLLTGRKHAEGGIPSAFGQLEGGEYVVNRSATEAFMPLLDKINGMGKGSGAPNNLSVVGEQTIPAPAPIIKTYVVASDMTNEQEANRRLEQIARL